MTPDFCQHSVPSILFQNNVKYQGHANADTEWPAIPQPQATSRTRNAFIQWVQILEPATEMHYAKVQVRAQQTTLAGHSATTTLNSQHPETIKAAPTLKVPAETSRQPPPQRGWSAASACSAGTCAARKAKLDQAASKECTCFTVSAEQVTSSCVIGFRSRTGGKCNGAHIGMYDG